MKYKVGDRVEHETYGVGTIEAIDKTFAPYCVKFDKGSRHWCSEKFLTLIADEPKNLMPDVLDLLKRLYGIDQDEEFEIVGASSNPHKLTENGLTAVKGKSNCTLSALLRGEYTIKKLPWKPKEGEVYCYVDKDGSIKNVYFNSIWDDGMFLIGNCFRTKKEAEANKKQVKERLGLEEWME